MATVALTIAPLLEGDFAGRRLRERATVEAVVRMMTGREDAEVGHTAAGAPQLEGLHISVSHDAERVAVALSKDAPVGVDTERPAERLERVVPRILRPDDCTDMTMLQAWTAKEAVFKCAGEERLVLSDIRLTDSARRATIPDGRTFAVYFPSEGLALAIEIH